MMPSFCGPEEFFSGQVIAPYGQQVIDPQEMKVDKSIFCFFNIKATTNDMRDHLDAIFKLDGSRDPNGTRPFSKYFPFDASIFMFPEFNFLAVISNFNKLWDRTQSVDRWYHRWTEYPCLFQVAGSQR